MKRHLIRFRHAGISPEAIMNNFLPKLSEDDLEAAKRRIWNGMQDKLENRGLSMYQSAVSVLREARESVISSRLQRVQAKENFLAMLPNRRKMAGNFFTFQRKAWAAATLCAFFVFLFLPVLQMPNTAFAAGYNELYVAQGTAMVNGNVIGLGDTVYVHEGDRIYTGQGSMAHLYFVDDSRVTMGPETDLQILRAEVNPRNSAQTGVVVSQSDGRVWAQVLNLVSRDAYFNLQFPDGEVSTSQRSTFDVQVKEDSVELQVVRNLVEVIVEKGEKMEGTLGQGALLSVGEDLLVSEISEEDEANVWWGFNVAQGKAYSDQIEEKYNSELSDDVMILPGNPLYVFKTLREGVQETLTFSEDGKQKLASQHAQNRLDEAQVLIQQGNNEKAKEVLDRYQEKIEESLSDSDNEALLASASEAKKSVLSKKEMDAGAQMLDSYLNEASATVTSDPITKNEVRMFSASQKLSKIPDLIADGDYEKALIFLTAYKEESTSILVKLQDVSLEDRDELVGVLLEQKLKDLQMLRIIEASEFGESLDVDSQMLGELSMMVLSLRERALDRLSEFFTNTNYNLAEQKDVYARLKNSSEMEEGLEQQFAAVEDKLTGSLNDSAENVLVNVQVEPVLVDDRFELADPVK